MQVKLESVESRQKLLFSFTLSLFDFLILKFFFTNELHLCTLPTLNFVRFDNWLIDSFGVWKEENSANVVA